MNQINKNTIILVVVICLFFVALGLLSIIITVYDMTRSDDDDNIMPGIVLGISAGFICFPISFLVLITLIYIIKKYDSHRYAIQPIYYTENGSVEIERF